MRSHKSATETTRLSPAAAADVRTVAGGGGLQIVGQFFQRSLALAFTAVAVRILGPGGYGIYRLVAQMLTVGGLLGSAGFEYAVVREVASARAAGEPGRVRGTLRTVLRGTLLASGVVTVALLVLAPDLASAFADDASGAENFAFLLRLGVPFVPLFALGQVLRFSTHPYRTMVPSVMVANVIRPTSRFVLGVGALLAGFALSGAVLALVLGSGMGLLAAIFYVRRISTEEERRAAPVARTGAIVRFAFLQGTAALLNVQALGLGIIILGLYRPAAEVGLFGVALSLLTPVNVLFSAIAPIWAPVVTELLEKREVARLNELFQTVNRWLSSFGFPILAALAIQPDVFLGVLVGRTGSGAEPALVILALGHFFLIGTGPTALVLSMSGHPGANLGHALASALLFTLLGVLVAPAHGLVGMACVNATVTVVSNLGRLIHVRLLIGIQPFGRTFFKPVVATLAASLPMLAAAAVGDFLFDIVSVGLAGLVYLIALRLLGLDPQEAHVLEQLKSRVKALRSAG